jgi:hypothetical protein
MHTTSSLMRFSGPFFNENEPFRSTADTFISLASNFVLFSPQTTALSEQLDHAFDRWDMAQITQSGFSGTDRGGWTRLENRIFNCVSN